MEQIALTGCKAYTFEELRKAVDFLWDKLGFSRLVTPGMTAVIKPNLVIKSGPDGGVATHPLVVAAVGVKLKELGANVLVAESPGGIYTPSALRTIYAGCGYLEMSEQYGIDLNYDCSHTEVEAPHGVRSHHFNTVSYTHLDVYKRQGEIHDAERDAQTPGGFLCNELPHACDFKCGTFYNVRNCGDVTVPCFFQSGADDARAGNSHVHNAVRFTGAKKSPRHERVVFRGVAEHHKFGRADAVAIGGALGKLADNAAHFCHRIHIDAGFRGADIDGRADTVGAAERFGNTFNQSVVARSKPLMDKGGISSNKVDAHRFCRPVQRLRKTDGAHGLACRGHHGDGSYRDTFVNDRNSIFFADVLTLSLIHI